MGRWDSVSTKSAFWKVGQRADQAVCAEDWKLMEHFYVAFVLHINLFSVLFLSTTKACSVVKMLKAFEWTKKQLEMKHTKILWKASE